MSRLERLKMGKVLPQHLKQYNELLRYVFQVTNKELQQVGWEGTRNRVSEATCFTASGCIGLV